MHMHMHMQFPDNIEALVELKDYMETVPELVKDLQPDLDATTSNYGVIDACMFQLEGSDFTARWNAFAWPKEIADKMVEVQLVLEEEKNMYAEKQVSAGAGCGCSCSLPCRSLSCCSVSASSSPCLHSLTILCCLCL